MPNRTSRTSRAPEPSEVCEGDTSPASVSIGAHPAALHFDKTAERYERTRPGYPKAALECIVAELGIDRFSSVLDLAAGTGKLTRQLTSTGATVLAAEPLAGMRLQLRQAVPEALLVGAAAEAIPLATGSLSAVTVAQAFHWFRPELAQPEIHRVLKPGGSLGIIGYRYDRKVPWVLRLIALSNRYRRGPRKRLRAQLEKACATAMEAAPPVASMLSLFPSAKSKPILLPHLFTLDREHRFYDYQELDVESLLERLGVTGKLAKLPLPERERLRRDVDKAVSDLPARIMLPYEVRFFCCRRR